MSFLSTFFNVGKYSDKEIAEAAGLYYGLGPIDSAAVSASAANAEANVTVNVNIGEQTATGGKQYVPERAHDGEYHVIYKNKDDTSPAPTNGKKAEAKSESQKPKAEAKSEKTAEKAPAQPKQEKPETPKSEANPEPQKQVSKPEGPESQKPKAEKTDQKAAQPQPKQEKAETPKSEANPEPQKQVSKPEGPESQKPKAEKTAEKAPAQPKPVEVTDQQAAHTLNNGFDYTHFQNSQTQPPMPVIPAAAPVFPANYKDMMPEQRCDALANIINRGLLPPMNNPRPGLSAEQKLEELKKHISFMDVPDRQIGQIRINSLLTMIASPSLKNAMSKNNAVDRPNNPKLTEVPVNKYATGDQLIRFDMAFEAKLKDPKKVLVVLYSTVPNYDPIQGSWTGDLCMFMKEIQ